MIQLRLANMIKRLFDLAFVLLALFLLWPLILATALLVRLTSRGHALYWSQRVGKNNTIFLMPKFRSMLVGTPQIATHLMSQQSKPDSYLTPVGSFIRKTSLDELPQLWSVFKGDMSIVGPRPALFNQYDLIELRTEKGVHKVQPGITGWAQINGRDEVLIHEKVELDVYYLKHRSIWLDFKIVLFTVKNVFWQSIFSELL
jgi:O-antigen biosynthesis protein WbqP